jgi:hypothetical protein
MINKLIILVLNLCIVNFCFASDEQFLEPEKITVPYTEDMLGRAVGKVYQQDTKPSQKDFNEQASLSLSDFLILKQRLEASEAALAQANYDLDSSKAQTNVFKDELIHKLTGERDRLIEEKADLRKGYIASLSAQKKIGEVCDSLTTQCQVLSGEVKEHKKTNQKLRGKIRQTIRMGEDNNQYHVEKYEELRDASQKLLALMKLEKEEHQRIQEARDYLHRIDASTMQRQAAEIEELKKKLEQCQRERDEALQSASIQNKDK